MGFNFPNAPTVGQIFTPFAGGPTYKYVNGVWTIDTGKQSAYVSDTPPPAPFAGQLWWESDSGNFYIYYDDGNSQQWVQVISSAANSMTADTFNRIINPALMQSQENGNTMGTVSGYFVADQWQATIVGITMLQAGRQAVAGGPYQATMQCSAKASLAASDYWMFTQQIEGIRIADLYWGTANAQPAVLRFDVYGTAAGTYSACLRGVSTGSTWVGNFTIPTTQWKTISFAIPPCTIGTAFAVDTSRSMELDIVFAAGSTVTAPALGWSATTGVVGGPGMSNGAATSASFYIRNIGLYLDPGNTGLPPPWQAPDLVASERDCLRYYERIGMTIATVSDLTNTSWYRSRKRISPTLSLAVGAANGATFGGVAQSPADGVRQIAAATGAADGLIIANARM